MRLPASLSTHCNTLQHTATHCNTLQYIMHLTHADSGTTYCSHWHKRKCACQHRRDMVWTNLQVVSLICFITTHKYDRRHPSKSTHTWKHAHKTHTHTAYQHTCTHTHTHANSTQTHTCTQHTWTKLNCWLVAKHTNAPTTWHKCANDMTIVFHQKKKKQPHRLTTPFFNRNCKKIQTLTRYVARVLQHTLQHTATATPIALQHTVTSCYTPL